MRWAPEEEQQFYDVLKTVLGQKPERCFLEVSKAIQTKDFNQARRRGGHSRDSARGGWPGPRADGSPPGARSRPDSLQVRQYYYRLIKRLNKILSPECRLDSKTTLLVHQSMVKFWDVVRPRQELRSAGCLRGGGCSRGSRSQPPSAACSLWRRACTART